MIFASEFSPGTVPRSDMLHKFSSCVRFRLSVIHITLENNISQLSYSPESFPFVKTLLDMQNAID